MRKLVTIAAASRTSDQSLYRHFFAFKRDFMARKVDYYVNVDFMSYVTLLRVPEEGGNPVIVGGARYVIGWPGQAEVAFAVNDAHQSWGIDAACML